MTQWGSDQGKMTGNEVSGLEQRYELHERLASGGMADIYRAHDRLLHRWVVLKRMRPPAMDEFGFEEMFLDEARTLAALKHPNIVELYDIRLNEGAPVLVMEYLSGWDVRLISAAARFLQRNLDLGVVIHLLSDACKGLHAVHAALAPDGRPLRIVHRDISPANLFVTTHGTLKLLDFGVAKSDVKRRMSVAGELKGKMPYMSPEQITGRPLDQRSDLFSLGIILHELLSGRQLFSHDDPEACWRALTRDPIPPPQGTERRIPAELTAVTLRALERQVQRRFQAAAEMHDALNQVAARANLRCEAEDAAAYLSALLTEAGARQHSEREAAAAAAAHERSDARRSVHRLAPEQTVPEHPITTETAAQPSRPARDGPSTPGLLPGAGPGRRKWPRWRTTAALPLVASVSLAATGAVGALLTPTATPTVRPTETQPVLILSQGDSHGERPDATPETDRQPDPLSHLTTDRRADGAQAPPRPAPQAPLTGAGRPGPTIVHAAYAPSPRGHRARATVRWLRAPDATAYEVQLSTNPAFDAVAVQRRVSRPVLRLQLAPEPYYVRIRARGRRGWSDFSEAAILRAGSMSVRRTSPRRRGPGKIDEDKQSPSG